MSTTRLDSSAFCSGVPGLVYHPFSVDPDALAMGPSEQLVDGTAEQSSFDIPKGDIDAGERGCGKATSPRMRVVIDRSPMNFGIERIFPRLPRIGGASGPPTTDLTSAAQPPARVRARRLKPLSGERRAWCARITRSCRPTSQLPPPNASSYLTSRPRSRAMISQDSPDRSASLT